MTNLTQEINIGSFSFYITWDEDGKQGVDQRGTKWFDRKSPKCEIPAIPIVCELTHSVLNKVSSSKIQNHE